MSDDEESDATTKVTRKKSMKKIKGMESVQPKHE